MDIRAQRTNAMLASAFGELLEEKQLEQITVSELCARSTVRRATFYRHYENMNAFMRYYLTTMTQRFMDELAEYADLEELLPYARNMHRHMLAFAAKNRSLYLHVMGQHMLVDTMDMAVLQAADGIIARIEHAAEEGAMSLVVPARTVGIYYAAGLLHTMRWWILDDDPAPIDEVVEADVALLSQMVGLPQE